MGEHLWTDTQHPNSPVEWEALNDADERATTAERRWSQAKQALRISLGDPTAYNINNNERIAALDDYRAARRDARNVVRVR